MGIWANSYLGSRFTREGAERVHSGPKRLVRMILVGLAAFLTTKMLQPGRSRGQDRPRLP
jgi:hypothetical protein